MSDAMTHPLSRRAALRWMVSGAGLALVAACSAPAPQASQPTAAPAAPRPTSAPPPTPGAAPTAVAVVKPTAAPAAAAAAAPTVAPTPAAATKLVVSLPTPQYEGNEIRMMQQPDSVQWRPMYEYLIGFDAENGKLVPQLATDW